MKIKNHSNCKSNIIGTETILLDDKNKKVINKANHYIV